MITIRLPPQAGNTSPFDLAFTTVGRMYNVTVPTIYTMQGQVQITGLATLFILTPRLLMGQCPFAATTLKPGDNSNLIEVSTNYSEARIVDVKITATNAGSSTIHGLWSLSFWPFNSSSSVESFERYYSVTAARNAPIHVEGPASRKLTLSHKFSINNPYLYQVGGYDKGYGVVSLVYSEPTCTSENLITAAEFDPILMVSGSVFMTTRHQAPTSCVNSVHTIDLPGVTDVLVHSHALQHDALKVETTPGENPTFTGKPWSAGPIAAVDMTIL